MIEMVEFQEVPLRINDMKAHLAAEIAAGLSSPAEIRRRYNLSKVQWDILKSNPTFQHMVKEAVEQLQGDLNTTDRIRLKAAIAVEDSMETLYKMAFDDTIPAASRIDAQRQLARLAKVDGSDRSEGGPKDGFSITINLSGGAIDLGAKPIDVTPDASDP